MHSIVLLMALILLLVPDSSQAANQKEEVKNQAVQRYYLLKKIVDSESKNKTAQSMKEAEAFEEMIFLEPLVQAIEAKQAFNQSTCNNIEIRIKNLSPQKKNKYQQSSMEILKKICLKN